MELRELKPEELELSLGRLRRLPEKQVARMVASLRSKGQLSSLVAAEHESALVLIDGFVRLLAIKRLGLTSVKVEVVQVSNAPESSTLAFRSFRARNWKFQASNAPESSTLAFRSFRARNWKFQASGAQMKAQMYLRNRERGLSLVEECRLVRELVEVDGLTQVEASELLERHKSWVCRRLALLGRLSQALAAEPEIGALPAGSLSRLARLPARNQEELWAVAQKHSLGGSDVGRLAELARRAPDPLARAWLLRHPAEALACARGDAAAPLDPRLGPRGEELRRTLAVIGRASASLGAKVRLGLGGIAPEGVAELKQAHGRAFAQSEAALRELRAALEAQDG